MTMSIQLTATWTLAMCALVVMATLTVAWKLNLSGELVDKKTGRPYDATPQFDPNGTHHFFPGGGRPIARLENHECDTKNCERQQITENGVALQNQQWTSHHGASRRIVPCGASRRRFDIITRMAAHINLCYMARTKVYSK
jgi:hypothetical protein